MFKFLSATAVLFLLSGSSTAFAQAQRPGEVRVSADRTALRDRAATDGGVVATVVKGDQLAILSASGSWFRVRTSDGREGFVHSLFIEPPAGPIPSGPSSAPQVSGVAASMNAVAPARPTAVGVADAPAPAQTPAPRFAGNGSQPMGNRRFGVGLANIGPSVRYWMDATKGFQVDGYFSSNYGYSVSAISPSFVARFSQPKDQGSVTFAPYWGGGVTLWHFDSGYRDYYCGLAGSDCSSTSLGFGGFVGAEMAFKSVPKLALSGNVGYYTARLGYGGVGVGLGVHFYPGAKP